MNATILLTYFMGMDTPSGYCWGAIIVLLLVGYLVYVLVNPEKF